MITRCSNEFQHWLGNLSYQTREPNTIILDRLMSQELYIQQVLKDCEVGSLKEFIDGLLDQIDEMPKLIGGDHRKKVAELEAKLAKKPKTVTKTVEKIVRQPLEVKSKDFDSVAFKFGVANADGLAKALQKLIGFKVIK